MGDAVAKTLVEIDERLLQQAAAILGTRTKKDTVNAALREAVEHSLRREHLERIIQGGLPDLSDSEVMASAWR